MFLTGLADEAGKEVDTQIKATKALGWHYIELRAAGEKNLATMSDEEFDRMQCSLDAAGVKINCFGSGIANWTKSLEKEEDFNKSIKELQDAITRMHRLGTKLVRGMSFKVLSVDGFDSPELERAIFKKISHLVKICEK
jgi:sugar phosphate isomerase/epimerase